MNARSLALLVTALTFLLGWAAPAAAQTTSGGPVLVYKLSFKPLGDSINFHPYQGGYYVADIATGNGTMLLTKVLGNTRRYYTLTNYGAIFNAIKGGERKAILSASKTTTTTVISNITFHAVGDVNKEATFKYTNGDFDAKYANKLEGVAIFDDSQEDLPFAAAPGADIGTAGTSSVTLTLMTELTETSRKLSTSRTQMINNLKLQLADQNYTNGDAATTTTGTGTGNTTTTP